MESLFHQLRDHGYTAVAKKADDLRQMLRRIDQQLTMLTAVDSQPKGFLQWLIPTPKRNVAARRGELCEERTALKSALDAIEAEEDELNEDYANLFKQHSEATTRYKAAFQQYSAAMREREAYTPSTPPQSASPAQDGLSRTPLLERLRAIAARESGRARERAWRIKSKMRAVTDECAYCGGPLGNNPHADHIHPIAKGGLSVAANMVMVCETCNIKKGTDTLQAFIRTFSLDRDAIERRLLSQGKDF